MNAKRIFAGIAAMTLASTLVACGDLNLEEDTTGKQPNDSSDTGDSGSSDGGGNKNVVGNWKILNKPNIQKDTTFGGFKTVKLKVKNVSGSEDEPWLEIRLTKGKNLVTTFDCIGQTVRPGERTTLDCTTMDDYHKWTEYEIKNAF